MQDSRATNVEFATDEQLGVEFDTEEQHNFELITKWGEWYEESFFFFTFFYPL